ncbi:redoxin domain-containing protein [Singulisphaera sp. Ch08]|uniref:Redoxin domain-containing protein n=1 Tax=Singulisphaera sp. Ch08 TaxID=3120278 RepID=A0AAU7CLW7_9BACT
MSWNALRRWTRNSLLAVVLLAVVGFLARDYLFFTFLYQGTRADWELSQVPNEYQRARSIFAEQSRRLGAAPRDVEQARERLSAREAELRGRCLTLAAENLGTKAELTAYYLVGNLWPKSREGEQARAKLLELAVTADMQHWGRMLATTPVGRVDGLRPLGAALVRRVKANPDDPSAACVLARACSLVAPDTDAGEATPEFAEVADLIAERYATSPDIVTFVERIAGLGGGGQSPPWSQPFEPHLRRILAANHDRFVRCGAKMALASLVQASGESRQPEAETLYQEFLAEFDGEHEYHAQGIEKVYRRSAELQLSTIRSHGLGKTAPEIVGVDLDDRPISLNDYHGKVVLVSFWATWCFPCMKMIPHEKEVAERFNRDRFAIVGVNSDTDLRAAREAVDRHGITWRSFRNGDEGPGQISQRWKVVGYPTLYLLDHEGVVRKRWIGNPPLDDLVASIERLLSRAAGGPSPKADPMMNRRSTSPPQAEYARIEVSEDAPTNRGFIGKVHRSPDGRESKYCIFIPRGYEGKSPTPTILFLHGSGYVGSDGRKQLTGALADAIKHHEDEFPFLTIFPQSQEGGWQAGSADGMRAMAILDAVSLDYAVDLGRVYLTGLSMGGEGVWSLAAAHPKRWAAIVPICGGGDPGVAQKIKDIPCWCFHGDADRMIHPEQSRAMIRALQGAGGRPLYHEYPGVDHNCWDRTYSMPDLYQWMLGQRRGESSHGD